MIERVLIALVTQLGSALISWVIGRISKKQTEPVNEVAVESRLNEVKTAYTAALDGTPVTKEQRVKINKAISNFIRGGSVNGL